MSEVYETVGYDKESLIAFGVFVGIFGALAWHVWDYTVDDAFIVARYARRLLAGEGYNFTDGPATDGVTGPLWLVPALLGEALGGYALVVQKLAGWLGTVLAVGVAFFSLQYTRARAYFLAFCLVQSNLVVWSIAGLETGLATLLATFVFVFATTMARPANIKVSAGAFAASAGLLATLRPESLPFCVLACLLAFRAKDWGTMLRWAAVPVAAALLLATVRLAAFGHPLPLSYFAKSGGVDVGYVVFGLIITTAVVPLIVAAVQAESESSGELRAGLSLLGVWLISVAWAGGDWMPGFRLLVPILPGIGWLLARTFSNVGVSLRVSFGMCLLVSALDAFVQVPRAKEAGERRLQEGAALVRAVESAADEGPVALVDIGLIGYETGLGVLDLGGVTDPRVGKALGAYLAKQIDIGLIESAAPALIVLHSAYPLDIKEGQWPNLFGYPIENWVYTQPWTRANYEPVRVVHYAPGYHYLLLKSSAAAEAKMSASSP